MAKDISMASGQTSSTLSRRKSSSNGMWSLPSAGDVLIASVACLLVFGLVMVTSASLPFTSMHDDIAQLHFFYRQLAYITLGVVVAFIFNKMPLKWFYDTLSLVLGLFLVLILLSATLLFGSETNGAKRWLELGSFNFQVAELAKLVIVIYSADFVVRRTTEVRQGHSGIVRMLILVCLLTWLLLMQPDFGSSVLLIGTILAIFFVAGAPRSQIVALVVVGIIAVVLTVIFKDYRFTRVNSYLDPFDDISGSDYQLSRSLIAFGRGELTGVGYGESVQKLAHLPEAHTDFVLAITGEEIGFIGVMTVLLLEAAVIASSMRISYIALRNRQMRLSYTAFGIGIIFIGHIVINAGMNMGVLPPKGLTMPFFSYGGSAMLISLIMVGILLNIHRCSPKIPANRCRHY